MMSVLYLICACYYIFPPLLGNILVRNTTTKQPIEDDYYLSYDYDISNNSKDNIKADSLILPNPASIDTKSYAVDVLPNIELPDDSLADPDLKDHNCIDNIMYVYYGGNGKNSKSNGPEIIIIGSGLSCAAQLMTLCCSMLKKYVIGRNYKVLVILVHIFTSMLFGNFVFMLGGYQKDVEKCMGVAFIVNLLYHFTVTWIFVYCLYIYKKFCRSWVAIFYKHMNLFAFVTDTAILLMAGILVYIVPETFETKKFCFMSIKRGTFLNFMIPICTLLILTTVYAISAMIKIEDIKASQLDDNCQIEWLPGLKELEALKGKRGDSRHYHYQEEKLSSLKDTMNCLKTLCVMQVMFVLYWFLTPFALDASYERTELPYLHCTIAVALNWFIFFKRKILFARIDYTVEENSEISEFDETPSSATEVISIASSDNIPLLKSDSATELKEFCNLLEPKDCAKDYNICTICT